MLGTTGATIVIVIGILFACMLGIGTGGLTCLALRRSWNLKQALIDALLTVFVTVATAWVIYAIDIPRGIWKSRNGLILAIALGSVVVRHFTRFVLNSQHKHHSQ